MAERFKPKAKRSNLASFSVSPETKEHIQFLTAKHACTQTELFRVLLAEEAKVQGFKAPRPKGNAAAKSGNGKAPRRRRRAAAPQQSAMPATP